MATRALQSSSGRLAGRPMVSARASRPFAARAVCLARPTLVSPLSRRGRESAQNAVTRYSYTRRSRACYYAQACPRALQPRLDQSAQEAGMTCHPLCAGDRRDISEAEISNLAGGDGQDVHFSARKHRRVQGGVEQGTEGQGAALVYCQSPGFSFGACSIYGRRVCCCSCVTRTALLRLAGGRHARPS